MDQKEEKEYLRSVGEKLREYRTIEGLSQEQACEKIGISQTQYSKIEQGNAKASITTLLKIISAYDKLSCDYLITNDNHSQHECINILRNILKDCPNDKIDILKELLQFAEKMVKS